MQGLLNRLSSKYELARKHFYWFCVVAIGEIEPTWTVENKFSYILINEIQAFLSQRKKKTMLIQAPPRTGKTELVSIYNIARLIGIERNKRFLVVSGNQGLSRKLRRSVRRIISTQVYKQIFLNFSIKVDNATEIQTNSGNIVHFTTTFSQVPTGEGYHYIFLEDFMNATVINSEAKTDNAFEQLDGILSRTQNDPETLLFVNNQRLSDFDLSYIVKQGHKRQNIDLIDISLPYYFIKDFQYTMQDGKLVKFSEGEFLVDRFNHEQMREIKARGLNGEAVFETQYQQNPTNMINAVIDHNWFGEVISKEHAREIQFEYKFLSCDTAYKTRAHNDYSALVMCGIYKGKMYLLDVVRVKVDFGELKHTISQICKEYSTDNILIEDNASGQSLIQELKNAYKDRFGNTLYFNVIGTKVTVDKYSRLESCIPTIKAGNLVLVTGEWNYDYIQEFVRFRADMTHKHDDMVDATTQAIIEWNKRKAGTSGIYSALKEHNRLENLQQRFFR
jgi:predicted phage terminase large subunit-like protein